MRKVRGTSLSDEAVELGFWVVVGQVMGATSRSGGAVEVPQAVLAEITKRYEGDLEGLLTSAK